MRRRGVFALALLVVCAPNTVVGQSTNLSNRINDLFTFGDCGEPLCLDGSINAGTGHGQHFIPATETGAFTVVSFINDAIALNASNFPISGTSGGVTFKFVGGLPIKTSSSSGPVFGERAQTLGRGRFLMGANLSGVRFKTLRGLPLDNLLLTFTHQDIGNPGLGDPSFENDLINLRLAVYVDLLVSSFSVTYGLLDKVDLSVAVPVVNTSIRGRSTAQIFPFGPPILHFFGGSSADPILKASTATFGSATGIGDVAGRAKINFVNSDHFAAAILADVRFPTGNEKQLLGAGYYSARGLAIFSASFGQFNPHLNLGYFYRASKSTNDAIVANLGFDQALNDWATIAVDVLSEWQVGKSKFKIPPPVTYTVPTVRVVNPTQIPDKRDDRMTSNLGFKFRTGGGPTIVTNVAVPVFRGGLQPNVVWTGGLEFNF